MSKKYNNCKGFEVLLGVHTQALKDNSESVVEILEEIAHKSKSLSDKEKTTLKNINSKLRKIDKRVDSLDVIKEEEEEHDWFEF